MRMPYKMALLCSRVRQRGPLRMERHELRGHCIAHEDKHPSLYIALTEDLRGLVRCGAGCSAESVMQAADLTFADLYYEQDPWVEVDTDFEIVREDVEPDLEAFKTQRPCSRATDEDILLRHNIYSAFLDALSLSERHRQSLGQRKLSDEEIDKRQYKSLDPFAVNQAVGKLRAAYKDELLLKVPGFADCAGGLTFLQAGLQGFLVPVCTLSGHIQALQVRQDSADPKYLWISSAGGKGPSPGSPCHVPLGITAPVRDVRVTEGPLKADVAYGLSGVPTFGVAGVTNWKVALDVLKQAGAENVYVAFDMDTKKGTYTAAEALAFRLADLGFHVYGEIWDHAERH
jgi:DNA primase